MEDDEESQVGRDSVMMMDDDQEEEVDEHFVSAPIPRHRRSHVPVSTISPPDRQRAQFVELSETSEQLDRNERNCTYIATGILLCGVICMVAIHKLLIDWQGSPPPIPPSAPHRGRFVYLHHASWAEYESARATCLSPSDAEAAVWASTGEVCTDGTCLDIGDLLRSLEVRALRDGEAYSTTGHANRGVSVPCACAIRDEAGTVRSYLDPKLKGRRGQLYEAKIEIELFGGHVATLVVPQTALVEHRAPSTGEKVELRVDGEEAVRWVTVGFILGNE